MNEIPDFLNQGYQALRELRRNEEGGRVIYQARTVNLDQEVAIEEYRFALAETSREAFKAYQRLLEMLQGIDSPGLPLYLDAFETASGFCLVREYIKAPSLAELPDLKPKAIAHLALSVLDILVELQNSSPPIVHRNICPESILVKQSDRDFRVTLVDFGLPAFGEETSASSIVPGIPGFVPPEALFQKPLSRASDLYSLGATLICLLTGTPSTEISNLIDDNLQLNFQAQLSDIEPALIPWLEKMVSANVTKRYENATAAKVALERILAGQGQRQGDRDRASTRANNSENSDNIVRLRIPATPLRLASLGAIVFLSMNFITSCQGGPVKRLLATKECSECHLREAHLESAYLEGAKLQGSDLEEAKLQNAYLEGANLVGANLRSADLEKAKLEGANMEGSKLQGTNLHGANLDEVNLEGANLEGANLQGAKLKNAKLEGVNLKGANLEGANLEGANLEGAILERVNLENAILIRINLERADLRNAKLRTAKLESANLKDAKLEDADLREADLVRSHLKDAKLEDANLEKANLEDANLEGVKLEDANLEDANLEGANLEGANLEDAYLRGADLSNTNLQRAKLEGANLEGANLEDVNLEGAYLGNVNLKDANLKGAKLEGVNLKDANLDDAKIEDAKIETPPEETTPPEPSQ